MTSPSHAPVPPESRARVRGADPPCFHKTLATGNNMLEADPLLFPKLWSTPDAGVAQRNI